MKNNFYYNLDLPVKFVTNFIDNEELLHTSFDINFINSEFKQWLSDRDLYIVGECERFILEPHKTNSLLIHIDNPESTNHVKLNYVYCDTDHKTIWYRLKPKKELQFSETSIGTKYAQAKEEDCDEVFSAKVGTPGLFNAAELHGVPAVLSKRVTFSMTLAKISTGKLITWGEAEQIFKDFIC